ncbi:MAG: glutamine--fructose-6-phosphate transaminase (isomerizing) [Phenylobacterium sp.]|uniref:glutamine--fructose-6-phosphate transaminase (isomerizing) n=1 Tax=Phenylobacterium sp. TaxID=1871053 RepID=UPI0027324679|nr:glutamine--fructose-6-phosphate transaminase (isomerizing) [Phenylobacterium sp.]MDP3745634.1 glutamine--fructose-6-phosphate transaminase (isomerizing) [Phenylobacterium sp.]
MCGIIGIVASSNVSGQLLESLQRLEYRGYDSAGIATLSNGELDRRRAKGKLQALIDVVSTSPLEGQVGIGHTRWATHGAPSAINAHPHLSGRVAVVHNGIIENYVALKADLMASGHVFESDTDTEVVAHMIEAALASGAAPLEALKSTLDRLEGAYALAVIVEGENDLVMGARRGSPLVVGYGDGEMFIGSDALAVGPFTNRITYLEEGDYVAINRESARIFDAEGNSVERAKHTVASSAVLVEKGNYRHFMEKEIHEQPDSSQHTLARYIDPVAGSPSEHILDFTGISRLQVVACGTAYYAGLVGKYLIEDIAGIPVDIEIASEFRYRNPVMDPGTLTVAISQSGETADTLAALRWCKERGLRTAAIVNAHQSTMAREADIVLGTYAGPEICVLSTKAFTAQIVVLISLAIAGARQRGRIDVATERRYVRELLEAPRLIAQTLSIERQIANLAQDLMRSCDMLFLGRGVMYPMAMEGALKLKESSYIHAEGCAAGEMKHGPISLIDDVTPVVVLAPSDELFDKTMSNLREVIARSGPVTMITDAEGAARAPSEVRVIIVPTGPKLINALIYAVPLQLIAYHIGVCKGTDVDQPRNLAKSVTVE